MMMRLIRFTVLPFVISFLYWSCENTVEKSARGLTAAESFQNLPYFKTGTQVYQNSSTDPAEDQFNDHTHWLYDNPDSSAVLLDVDGPGSLFRIWSTGNSGDTNRIKIYLDGHERPDINETFNNFHNHRPLRDRPQVGSGAGDNYLAWWSYMPIAFQKSCRVVREGNFRPFYSITYHTYSDTTDVQSWSGKEDLTKLESLWGDPTTDPKSPERNIVSKTKTTVAPGQTAELLNLAGSGYVASIRINNYLPSKNLRIRMYWDNEEKASVDAPLKWFFGSVDNGGDVKALGIGTVNNSGYCFYPMPFWKNARIELVNLSDTTAANMDVEVAYNEKAYDQRSAGYFHAFANEVDSPARNYQCLKTQGRGHVVGMAKRMPKGGHACEADEIYYIDNRKFPDVYGTGEEDYSNCAWWKNTYNTYPTHGHIGNDCYYRIHYPDLLVYENGIDMEFESWQNYYIASVVWYYESDAVSLIKTDFIDVGDETSEKEHAYSVNGETWKGEKSGTYPGKRIYADSTSDNGRAYNGQSSFQVKVDKANKGVRIRLKTDNANFRRSQVEIDGLVVAERSWYLSKNNYKALWMDADFEVPSKYTSGKEAIKVTLRNLESAKPWSEYRYEIFSYKDGR